MQSTHTIQASAFERLIEGLTVAGVDPDSLLRELTIDRKLLDDPEARIPFRKYAAMFEAAAKRRLDGPGEKGFNTDYTQQYDPQTGDPEPEYGR